MKGHWETVPPGTPLTDGQLVRSTFTAGHVTADEVHEVWVQDVAPEAGVYAWPGTALLYRVDPDGQVWACTGLAERASLPPQAVELAPLLTRTVEQHREAVDVITRDVLEHYRRHYRAQEGDRPLAGTLGASAVNTVRTSHGLDPITEGDL